MASGTDSRQENKAKVPFLGSGTEWIIFSISLLTAVIVWLVYNLSQPYSTFMDFPVNITSNIPGYESRAEADQRIVVRGKASGFYILFRKATFGSEPLEIRVDGRFMIPIDESNHSFAVATSNLRKELSSSFDGFVDMEYVLTDTITLSLTPTLKKKVPVRADASLSCAPQYEIYNELTLKPDSVYISGTASMVSSIDAVWTEKIDRSGMDGNIQGLVNIIKINGLDISVPAVTYHLGIRRYVEENVTVPVKVKNLPADRRAVLFPDYVTLTFRRWYPLAGRVDADDFEVAIDYDQFITAYGSTAIPKVYDGPEGSFGYALNPPSVEYVLVKR